MFLHLGRSDVAPPSNFVNFICRARGAATVNMEAAVQTVNQQIVADRSAATDGAIDLVTGARGAEDQRGCGAASRHAGRSVARRRAASPAARRAGRLRRARGTGFSGKGPTRDVNAGSAGALERSPGTAPFAIDRRATASSPISSHRWRGPSASSRFGGLRSGRTTARARPASPGSAGFVPIGAILNQVGPASWPCLHHQRRGQGRGARRVKRVGVYRLDEHGAGAPRIRMLLRIEREEPVGPRRGLDRSATALIERSVTGTSGQRSIVSGEPHRCRAACRLDLPRSCRATGWAGARPRHERGSFHVSPNSRLCTAPQRMSTRSNASKPRR